MTEAVKSPRSLFLEAVEKHSPDRWPDFLDLACGDDPHLRDQVTRLLDAHGRLDGFMAHPAAPPLQEIKDQPAGQFVGQTIGRYKLLEQIGEGGMGIVYVAEQTEPVRRRVALKIIKPGMDSRQVIARFEAERQALALMDHPNIARILDAGTTESSRHAPRAADGDGTRSVPATLPYFVMELVRGLAITDYCDQARLTPRQRLALFVTVCQAVQHAHQKGIIHRDLKPSNVLVTLADGQPVVKVIDFGVAKALSQQLTEHTIYTQFAQMIGTPLYMSPEQAELSAVDIDTRSDVYSLGVLLYELLTGRTPFDAETLKNVGFDEMRRMIREDEPPRPSARLSTLGAPLISTISERRGLDHRRLAQHIRGELDWIVMKALDKDRSRRYESASALAADVQRYLDHLPIQARPASLVTRALKWRQRNPVAFLAGVASVLVLASAIGAGLWHNHRLANSLAETKRHAAKVREEQYASAMSLGMSLRHADNRTQLLDQLDRFELSGDEPDVRGFEWHYLRRVSDPKLTSTLGRHQAEVVSLDVSPDSRFVASGDMLGGLCIWDLESRQRIKSLQLGDFEVKAVRFSPDGKWLATGGTDKVVSIWTVPGWQLSTTLKQHDGSIVGLTWSPDGRQLASASRGDGLACVWNAGDWSLAKSLSHAGELANAAWSPQGNLLAILEREAGVRLWDTVTWEDRGLLDCRDGDYGILAVAFSPDGSLVAAGGHSGKLWLFDSASRELLIQTTGRPTWTLAFYGNDRLIQGDGLCIRQWEISRPHNTLGSRRAISTGDSTHRRFALANNGRVLIGAGANPKQIAIYDTAALLGFQTSPVPWPRLVLPQRGIVIANDRNQHVTATAISSSTVLARIEYPCLEATVPPVASPDESLLAVVANPGEVQVWDTSTWEVRHTLPAPPGLELAAVAFSPDGQWLAAGFERGHCGVWNLATGQWRQFGQGAETEIESAMVAFSPQGLLVCAVWSGSEVAVWDVTSNKQVAAIPVPLKVTQMLFLADETLAVGDHSGWISLRNATTGLETGRLEAHAGRVEGLALSADGRTLASTGYDHAVRLWSVPTRRELFTIHEAESRVYWLTFEPNGDLTFRTADSDSYKPALDFPCWGLCRLADSGWQVTAPRPSVLRGGD